MPGRVRQRVVGWVVALSLELGGSLRLGWFGVKNFFLRDSSVVNKTKQKNTTAKKSHHEDKSYSTTTGNGDHSSFSNELDEHTDFSDPFQEIPIQETQVGPRNPSESFHQMILCVIFPGEFAQLVGKHIIHPPGPEICNKSALPTGIML